VLVVLDEENDVPPVIARYRHVSGKVRAARCRRAEWQREGERATPADLALDPDSPIVQIDDLS
jgi:hypothetical protein